MHLEGARVGGHVAGVAAGPVVADGVGDGGAVAAPGERGDGAAELGEGADARLAVEVPEGKVAVGAGGGEDVHVGRVEGDAVDGVAVDAAGRALPPIGVRRGLGRLDVAVAAEGHAQAVLASG